MANVSDKTGSTGSPTPRPGASLADMQRMTDDIGRMIHELRDVQAAMRRQMLVSSLLIITFMLIFGVLVYKKMKDNLTPAKIQVAVMEKANLIVPEIREPIKAVLPGLMSFYQQMAKAELEKMSPKIQARLKLEADKLPAELQDQLTHEIDARFQVTATRAIAELDKQFPTLVRDGGQQATEKLKDAVRAQGGELRDHIHNLYTAERSKVQGVLLKFPVPDVSQTNSDLLERQFLHSLVMLADYELLATEAPPSLEGGVGTAPVIEH